MNLQCDYSSAYCILHTTSPHTGHGMTFTIGRGNDIVCLAITNLASRLMNRSLSSLVADMGATWRYLVSDSQLRWIGPEKGVIHLALGAVVNALWDLWAKAIEKPVWRLVAEMSAEEFVRCVDFRYITDAITPDEAIELLKKAENGKDQRMMEAEKSRAVPAYTTSAGWLGYGEEKMRRLLEKTLAEGYKHFKLKVGGSLEDDKRRLRIARDVIGYDKGNTLMIDANQVLLPAILPMLGLWSFNYQIPMIRVKKHSKFVITELTSRVGLFTALHAISVPQSKDRKHSLPIPDMVRPRSNNPHEPPRPLPPLVHRRAHLPRRHPWPRRHPHGPRTPQHPRRHRRNVPKPHHLQAIPPIARN